MKSTLTTILLSLLLVSCNDVHSSIASSIPYLSSSNSPSSSLLSESMSSTSSEEASSSSQSSLNVLGISLELFNYLGALPETESFLPSFMNQETYTTNLDVSTLDYYQGFISKSSLPNKYFGAQLEQLWNHLGYADSLTTQLTTMLSHASELGGLYSTYLSGNPLNPYEFSATLGGFSFEIIGFEKELILEVSVGDLSVTLAVLELNSVIVYWAELFIDNDNRLLIYSTETELKIISNIEWNIAQQTQAKISYMLNITKNGSDMSGYSYERYGVNDIVTKNHLVFRTQNGYFSVAGERGDFIPLSNPKVNVETYRLNDGAYLGSQVLEDVPDILLFPPYYETMWFPLWSINGWNSIKFEEDNADDMTYPQVYFNGSNVPFDVHFNTATILFVVQKLDRKYDIELKKSYVFQTNDQGQRLKKEFLYPAFFIQRSELSVGPFGTANTRNSNLLSHTMTNTDITNIQNNYTDLKVLQAAYKTIDVDTLITNLFIELKNNS